MELQEYLDYVNSKKRIYGGSAEHQFMTSQLHDALRITNKINSEYHTPEEIQALFAELTNTEINSTSATYELCLHGVGWMNLQFLKTCFLKWVFK